jgi:hypothetical protein
MPFGQQLERHERYGMERTCEGPRAQRGDRSRRVSPRTVGYLIVERGSPPQMPFGQQLEPRVQGGRRVSLSGASDISDAAHKLRTNRQPSD